MTEENKKDEQATDVSSLISLCQRVDNLPVIQKIALKQKVSFHFEYTLRGYMRNEGIPSNKFGAYISLLETKPELYGNVCDILTENFVSEKVVEECLMYIRSGLIPYHFWTEKLIHDIHQNFYYNKASVGGLLAVYLGKALKASLIAFNKAIKALEDEFCDEFSYEENENAGRMGIIKREDKWADVKDSIAFVKTRALEIPQELKEKYMSAFATNDEVERVKFQENETTIFTETLIDMLKYPFDPDVLEKMKNGTSTPFEDFWITPPLGGARATLVSRARGEGDTMQQDVNEQQDQQGGMGSWWEMLGFGPNGETPEEMQRQQELEARQAALEEHENTRIQEFHWNNPSFRRFIEENDLADSFEQDMYDDTVEIDTDYVTWEHADLVNENFNEGDPEWVTEEDIQRIVAEARRFKPHAERAYKRFIEEQEVQVIEAKVAKSNERFEREKATRVISNEKNIKYCVQKVARDGSQRVMSENWFDTEKEAQDFVKEVTESNPIMAKAFEFKVETRVRN